MTLGLLSLSCPSGEELGGSEIAEGLVRPDGVAGASQAKSSRFRAAISREEGDDLTELLRADAAEDGLAAPCPTGDAAGVKGGGN